MTIEKPKVDRFLKESDSLLENEETVSESAEIIKRAQVKQAKEQLMIDLSLVVSLLKHIEQQQSIIIGLLKSKLDLESYEKEIMDLLKAKLEKE